MRTMLVSTFQTLCERHSPYTVNANRSDKPHNCIDNEVFFMRAVAVSSPLCYMSPGKKLSQVKVIVCHVLRMCEQTNGLHAYVRTYERRDGLREGGSERRREGGRDGWVDGGISGWISVYMFVCMFGSMHACFSS